jgi:hypothetical protein
MLTEVRRQARRSGWLRIGAVMAAVAMLMTVGVANAAGATVLPAAKPDGSTVTLTAAQRQALQTEVQKHLHDYGAGQQIGINQISWDGGRTILTLTLPGERTARAATEAINSFGVANCPPLYACLWENTNFEGDRLYKTRCETLTLAAPFNSSTASIHNNQTSGTQTLVMNGRREILNANLAPSRVNDTGVGTRSHARYWKVC